MTLSIDHAALVVMQALRDQGVPCLLLKGATLEKLLFDPGDMRPYTDVDLLVPPDGMPDAHRCLTALGYRRRVTYQPGDLQPHAAMWTRDDHSPTVDLHRTLHGVTVEDEVTWHTLWRDRQAFDLMDFTAWTLGPGDQAMFIALHSARPGPGLARIIDDLDRALQRVPHAVWVEAGLRARLLGADAAMAAGLMRLPDGVRLAARLALGGPLDWDSQLAFDPSLPQPARTLLLASQMPWPQRLAYLGRKLWPTPDFTLDGEHMDAHAPLAAPRAYLRRWRRLLRSAPAVLRTARRLRRETPGE